MAYEEGLQVDESSDILKRGLDEVKRAMDAEMGPGAGAGMDMGLGQMFSDPQLVTKLQNNAKTRGFMQDPEFAQKVYALQASGGKADMTQLFGDKRMLTVLGVLMGVDIVSLAITRINS
jgi:stress-induced-phosphoprotein 1